VASSSVFDNLKSRLGASVVVTVGGDGTSYRGTLMAARPDGTDLSDGGVSATANDYVTITVKLSRAKS
jgi:hypothetical protein